MITKFGYKLFEQNEKGELFPLFIGKCKETKIGEWVPAEYIPTNGFANRGGWHLSLEVPDAPHLRGYNGSDLGPYKSRFKNGKRVWCLVEYDSTNDYNEEVQKLPKKCFQDKCPENGFYFFREFGKNLTWVITSAIRIVRVIDENERQDIMKRANYDEVAAYAKYKAAFEKRMAA